MHLLCRILRSLSSMCGLNINLSPSSWMLSFTLSIVYFVVVIRRGWDKMPLCIFLDLVILEEISYGISKFVHGYKNLWHPNFQVIGWLCIEDAVIHKVLWHLFVEKVICTIAFVWGISKCMKTNGFTSRDISFLLEEKETLFRHHKKCLVARRAIYSLLIINLQAH